MFGTLCMHNTFGSPVNYIRCFSPWISPLSLSLSYSCVSSLFPIIAYAPNVFGRGCGFRFRFSDVSEIFGV